MRYLILALLFAVSQARADILLVGDSTMFGALSYVQAVMPCVQYNSNARDSGYLLDHIGGWLAGKQYSIIYFNVGLWDIARRAPSATNIWRLDPTNTAAVSVGINHYGVNLQHLAENIRAAQPGAIVIFATSTDVPFGSRGRISLDMDDYNARALTAMANQNVPVDDRHAFMLPYTYLHKLDTQIKVHYTAAGNQIMASHIVDVLQAHGGC